MEELTNLAECERPPFDNLKDLTLDPFMALEVILAFHPFVNLGQFIDYSGYGRPKANPEGSAPFFIEIWHGRNHYRTLRFLLPYTGVLYVDLPEDRPIGYYLKEVAA